MNEALSVIDTDVLSYILKEREPYLQRSCEYLAQHNRLTISCLTYYECLRGHKAAKATRQLRIFRKLLERTNILYIVVTRNPKHFRPLLPKAQLMNWIDEKPDRN